MDFNPFTSTTPDNSGYRYRGDWQGLRFPRTSEEAFGYGVRMYSPRRKRRGSAWRYVLAVVLVVGAVLMGVL